MFIYSQKINFRWLPRQMTSNREAFLQVFVIQIKIEQFLDQLVRILVDLNSSFCAALMIKDFCKEICSIVWWTHCHASISSGTSTRTWKSCWEIMQEQEPFSIGGWNGSPQIKHGCSMWNSKKGTSMHISKCILQYFEINIFLFELLQGLKEMRTSFFECLGKKCKSINCASRKSLNSSVNRFFGRKF